MRIYQKYLCPDPIAVGDEAGYEVRDGVIVDPAGEIKSNARKAWDAVSLGLHRQTREEQIAEEMRWASLSGPVTVRKAVS